MITAIKPFDIIVKNVDVTLGAQAVVDGYKQRIIHIQMMDKDGPLSGQYLGFLHLSATIAGIVGDNPVNTALTEVTGVLAGNVGGARAFTTEPDGSIDLLAYCGALETDTCYIGFDFPYNKSIVVPQAIVLS